MVPPGSPAVAISESSLVDTMPASLDKIFHFVCELHGVSDAIPNPSWRRRTNRVILSVRCFLLVATLPVYFRLLSSHVKDISFSEIASDLGAFIFLISGLYAVYVFATCKEEIRSLLQLQNRRAIPDVIFPVLCAAPYLVSESCKIPFARDWELFWAHIIFLHTDVIMVSIFIIYTDIVVNLIRRNSDILKELIAGTDSFSLSSAKWKIRDDVQKVNCTFARLLAMYYIEFFMLVIYFFAKFTSSALLARNLVSTALTIAGIAVQLFEIAKKASTFTSTSLAIEHHLSKLFRIETRVELEVFRFREDFDVFQVAVFDHSIANFLRFIGSGITCLAVILQFDYKISKKIATTSEGLLGPLNTTDV